MTFRGLARNLMERGWSVRDGRIWVDGQPVSIMLNGLPLDSSVAIKEWMAVARRRAALNGYVAPTLTLTTEPKDTGRYYSAAKYSSSPMGFVARFGDNTVQAVSFRQLVYRLKNYKLEIRDGSVFIASNPLVVKHLGTELAQSVLLKMWLDERKRWQGMANSFHSRPKGTYNPKSKATRLKGTF